MNWHRIINGLLGMVFLYITIAHAIETYTDLSTFAFNFSNLYNYIMRPISVLGWGFLTFCCFYVDVFGIVVNEIIVAQRAKRINKTRKNKQ